MDSVARRSHTAKVPYRRFHRPRLEMLEGRLPTGGMMAGLSVTLGAWLPGPASLDGDAGMAGLALTAGDPAASAWPPLSEVVLDSVELGAFSGRSGNASAVFTVSLDGPASPLASALAADPLQGLTPGRATPAGSPAVLAGLVAGTAESNAIGLGAGGDGPIIAAAPVTAGGAVLASGWTDGEQLPLMGSTPAAALSSTAVAPGTTTPSPNQAAQIRQQYGQMPLRFEANVGQTNAQVQFLAHGPGYNLFLSSTAAVMTLQRLAAAPAPAPALDNSTTPAATPPARGPETVLRMQILGGNPAAPGVGEQPLPGQVNYFLGNDPRQWHMHVATYARVGYADVYPGIDLTYYGNQQQLEYDFVIAPRADPSHIRLGFAGADSLAVDAQGTLEVQAGGQVLRQQAPVLYQDIAGARRPVAGRFTVEGQAVRFAVGAYDRSRPLVIDPVLSYSSYLGGSGGSLVGGGDSGTGIAVDGAGNAYVTGVAESPDFPTMNAFQAASNGNFSAFVTKVSADGSGLVYSTYLGGSVSDYSYGIAVDEAGNAYLTGKTSSPDFPTANAFQPTSGGGLYNAFVTKLSADGSTLVYSSYLGGSGIGNGDIGYGIAVDTAGNAYLTGQTYSTDFPTTNAFQPTLGGTSNAFVTKVSADGSSLVYSSYLGGSGYSFYGDSGTGIAVDAAGNAYLTGQTYSTDFPTANAFQPTKGGPLYNPNAFVTKFSVDGASLVYSSYLGGSNIDSGAGIAVDAAGDTYVTGTTSSTDFPTANAFQPAKGGLPNTTNAFVTKLSADGANLVYSTYLGGSNDDSGRGIAVDASGNAYVTGSTQSPDFPTANAFQPSLGGPSASNAFLANFSSDGTSLVYSTYLGGSGADDGHGIAVDGAGNAYLTGSTSSIDFPNSSAFQPLKGGTGAFQSTDGGATWHAIDGTPPNALTNADVRSLTVDPTSPSILYAGTNGGGVFRSTDAGTTWNASTIGLTNLQVQTVVLDPTDPATVYAGTNGGGVFQSTDSGNTWTAVNNGLTNLSVQTLAVDPTNSATVYAGTTGGFFRSADGGASWSASNNGLTSTNVRSLAVDPATPSTVYAATDGGIFKSTDGGAAWVTMNNGLPTNSLSTYALVIDPATPATLYTSLSYKSGLINYDAVYKSLDGAGTWSASSNGLPTTYLTHALAIDPVTPSTLYAAPSNSGVYQSTDGGATWNKTSLGGSGQALAVDPSAPSTVYAGDLGTNHSNAFVAKIS